jgi:hypothetical protein
MNRDVVARRGVEEKEKTINRLRRKERGLVGQRMGS